MKKQLHLFVMITILFSGSVFAQQEIQSTQFMLNPFMLNPAYSSVDDNMDFRTGYRNQWVGIEGAPNTYYTSVHGPIGKPRWARTHPGDFHNWHGTGMYILQDNIGAFRHTRINANYSYNIGLSKGINYGYEHHDGLRLSIGAFIGSNRFSVDKEILSKSKTPTSENIANTNTLNDPIYQSMTDNASFNALDMSLGAMLYYGEQYFLGISTTQLFQNSVTITEEMKMVRHYFVSGMAKLELNEEYYLIPSAILKVVKGAPMSYNLNLRLDWQDKLFAGLGYRSGDAIIGMIGSQIRWGEKVKSFRVDKHRYIVNFFYSYDYTISKLGKDSLTQPSKGSHEITVSFLLPPMFHERNAEDTWGWWKKKHN